MALIILQALHEALTNTTLCYETCILYFPVLLRTTKLAKYFQVVCAKLFPVLLRITKLARSTCHPSCPTKVAQNTSQYYCVLQNLHKVVQRLHETLPSTCTTSFHKVLLSATLCYKVCTNHFPALLCTTKLDKVLLRTEAFALILHREEAFAQREAFTQRSFYTVQLLQREAFTQRSFCTEKRLHREAFAQRSFYAEMLLYGEAFAQRNFYTNKLLHRETFSHSKLLHTEAFTYTMATEIAALRPDPGAKAKTNIKKKTF